MSAVGRSIGEVAAHLGLDADTLRYYERRGVVPTPPRDRAGRRSYDDRSVHLLEVLLHLRRTGMPLIEITAFTRLVAREPGGVPERLQLLIDHERRVAAQQEQLAQSMTVVQRKIRDYRQRLAQESGLTSDLVSPTTGGGPEQAADPPSRPQPPDEEARG
jgi:DNA-binding transcriptional MerR regulator